MYALFICIVFIIFVCCVYHSEAEKSELRTKLRKTEMHLDRVSYMLEQATDYKDEWEYDIFKGKKK